MIHRIVVLLEEQNTLLREVHLALTGTHAKTFRPSMDGNRTPRVRTGSDVWQRTPLTEQVQQDREIAAREDAARAPSSGEDFPSTRDDLGPVVPRARPTDAPTSVPPDGDSA